MPELPDITIYLEALERTIGGAVVEKIRIANPFLLRSIDPPVKELEKKRVVGFERLGKRIVFEFEDGLFAVIHLMIAGRLRWRKPGAALARKVGLAAFDFPLGTLLLTEASPKKRASLHLIRGRDGLSTFDRGGLEVFSSTLEGFKTAVTKRNHTLKRALSDPTILSGVGNAYSDEILHRARLSPLALTQKLSETQLAALHESTRSTLSEWTDRLREQTGEAFPEKVTAFHSEMAVHGKYRKPCPECGTEVQRILYAENEANYCPECQTGGKLLRDRVLSRLMKSDWPRTMAELEERRGG